jgi:hypothetical protein
MPFQLPSQPPSPENYPLITYLWVFGMSILGGIVSFSRKVRDGHARAWSIAEFLGEIATSAFAGIITFYLCEWSGFSNVLTASLVGIAGHMGSRAIRIIESFAEAKFKKIIKDDDNAA